MASSRKVGFFVKKKSLEAISYLLAEAAVLPVAVFKTVEHKTVGELLELARTHGMHVRRLGLPPKKPQLMKTKEIDLVVLRVIKSMARRRKERQVTIREVTAKVLDVASYTQVQRAFWRLSEKGLLTTEGTTRDRVYVLVEDAAKVR